MEGRLGALLVASNCGAEFVVFLSHDFANRTPHLGFDGVCDFGMSKLRRGKWRFGGSH